MKPAQNTRAQAQLTRVGLNIKRLRRARGWSQARLIEESGVTSVSMLESGKRKSARLESLLDLAWSLEVPVSRLFDDIDDDGLEACG